MSRRAPLANGKMALHVLMGGSACLSVDVYMVVLGAIT
jgi:hypothetical protein